MSDSTFTDPKVIELSRNFVNVIAHSETAHGDRDAMVGKEKVKLCTGHRTDSMVDRYKHLEPDSARGATDVLVSPLFQRRASAT